MHNPFSQFLINQENSYRRTKSFLSFKLGRTQYWGTCPRRISAKYTDRLHLIRKILSFENLIKSLC